MTKLLVTGGAGFIGSHLCEGLLARGHRGARAGQSGLWPARLCSGGRRIHRRRHPRSCHLPTRRRTAWRGSSIAPPCPAPAPRRTRSIFAPNPTSPAPRTCCWRRAMPGVKRFIYSGSSTYYGNRAIAAPRKRSARPAQHLWPDQAGGRSTIAFCSTRISTWPAWCCAISMSMARASPRPGPMPWCWAFFSTGLRKAKSWKFTATARQRRDFVHVRDVVAANILAYERAQDDGVRGEMFNVGSGDNLSVKELADMISPNQVHTEARKGDCHRHPGRYLQDQGPAWLVAPGFFCRWPQGIDKAHQVSGLAAAVALPLSCRNKRQALSWLRGGLIVR